MSEFDDYIDEVLGDDDSISDIRLTVRRCWFYDFNGYPVRLWQGQGKLFTADGQMWLGTIDARGVDLHQTPKLTDGRDGSSPTTTTTLSIYDMPGQAAGVTYEALKAEQWRVAGRRLVCYLVAFKEGEALRPSLPLSFFKELTMMSPRFSESVTVENGVMIKSYRVTVVSKDGNYGRSNVPNGTYADTIQKERAKQWGVELDRGCEFLAKLANRTYQLP